MNNNDYREITEDDVTTVSTDQKEEMNRQESVNDTPDVSENEKETVQAEVTNSDASDEKEPEYEDICYICRRPEHIAGKMIKIPNNICICQDCMQKTFDSMNQTGFSMDDMLNMNMGKMPNISMINLSDLQGMQGFIPNNQKIKKKKPKEKKEPVLDIKKIPAPHKIKASLDEYVVGQEHAKKVMSVAVYNHYKRIASDEKDGIEIEKSNMLMIGPTGSGKTYLVKTLAKLLDVPLAITDATSLTEAGYIGDDIESVVSKLLAAADNDVERAEHGIIFIDEIDKIAKKRNTNQRDVSGESVQQGMLKLLEGAEVEVPVGASSKNAMVPMTMINTKNILFICGGAFPELEDIIKERLNKSASIGFKSELKDKYDQDENILQKVTIEDVRKFGMIPEFLGRLPIMFTLEALTEDMLVRILKEPKNAILKQYQKLLAMDEVRLEFEDDALMAIAKQAKEKKVGARALRAIIEDFMLVANETVAEDYFWQEIPFLYRVHETPDDDKMKKLVTFLQNFGYTMHMQGGQEIRPKEVQKLLDKIEGTPEEAMISRLALRSMKQARYSPDNDGHFGLATQYYTHFTSPIRRYPDLQIHRIIKDNLRGRMNDAKRHHYEKILPEVAMETSSLERRADEAERETLKLKKVQYMRNFFGQEFEGVISGITKWGIYVELPNTVEGLVHVTNMTDDHYDYDEEHYQMIGSHHRKTYKLGQKVRVKMIDCDEISRTIDFRLVKERKEEREDG